jgi:hypothetical protein
VKDQVKIPDVITEPKHYGMHRHFTEVLKICTQPFTGRLAFPPILRMKSNSGPSTSPKTAKESR